MYGFQHLKAFNTFEPWGKVHVFASATSAYLRYDTTTVIDLVHAADLYLWGGAGFSSGKVSYLWTQRDEIFKSRDTQFEHPRVWDSQYFRVWMTGHTCSSRIRQAKKTIYQRPMCI